jgi:hypothetical protein
MIDEIMFEIREMTGQAYHNHYSGQPETERSSPSKVATVSDDAVESQRHLIAV